MLASRWRDEHPWSHEMDSKLVCDRQLVLSLSCRIPASSRLLNLNSCILMQELCAIGYAGWIPFLQVSGCLFLPAIIMSRFDKFVHEGIHRHGSFG